MKNLRKHVKKIIAERKASGRYIPVKKPGLHGIFDGETFSPDRFEDAAADLDSLMAGGTLLKDGGATKVAKIEFDGGCYVIKRYNWRGWRKGLRYRIKGARARRVWLYGHLLPIIEVNTPRPVCTVEKSKSGIVRNSYVINEYVLGTRLHDYLCGEHRTDSECVEILGKMRTLFETLHSHRITHGDLKRSNVLVTNGDICLIDLDATTLHRTGLVYWLKRRRDIGRFTERMLAEDTPPHIRRYCRELLIVPMVSD